MILGLLTTLLLVSQGLQAQDPARARDKLRQQAIQLQAAGDLQSALQIMQQLAAQDPQPATLHTLLDLQVQLRLNEEAEQTLTQLSATVPGWPDRFSGFQSLNTVGRIAGARHRMGQTDQAEALWQSMERLVKDETEASIVFHSYQDQRRFDRALEYAGRQRKHFSRPALWAMELALLHEQTEHWADAFDEYALLLQHETAPAPAVQNRLLRLADKATPRDALLARMEDRALKELQRNQPVLAGQVFQVCIQQKEYGRARTLAARLDRDGSAGLLNTLAHAAVADGSFAIGLELLDELQAKRPGHGMEAGERLDRALALEGLGQTGRALAEYDTLARDPGPLAVDAQLGAARLLHHTGARIEEASRRLERLLDRHPGELRAILYQIRLLAALKRFEDAEALRQRAHRQAQSQPETVAELEFLGIQLAWWRGDLSVARDGLKGFLEQESQNPIFNDAIDLMDLLAFAGSDSLRVVRAGEADRLAWSGQPQEAIDLLKQTAGEGSGAIREWLDWQVCVLAAAVLPADRALAEQDRYRERHTESIRLDRLQWMRYEVLERSQAPAGERLALLEEFLERWPDSILQDQVRREIRQLEELL